MHKSDTQTQRQIFTVAKLNHYTKRIIEGRFPLLWIEGEVSNLTKAKSGHWYFSLKDEQAQVRCIMFRQAVVRSNCPVENGDKVLVNAQATFYEPRGDFQLQVELLEDAGLGALQRAYQELFDKLQSEGLFNQEHKKPLTEHPAHVALITSDTGAAIHDLLTVFNARSPLTKITLIPALVQGKSAPQSLKQALTKAESLDEIDEIDAIIIGRGGGSLEDLWAFNDESLARAIFNCTKLIVSAVGHESDVTIADYVADIRAATPSQAAEILSPDSKSWLKELQGYELRLSHALKQQLRQQKLHLDQTRRMLVHPSKKLNELAQRLDYATLSLNQSTQIGLNRAKQRLEGLGYRIENRNPKTKIELLKNRVTSLNKDLGTATHSMLDEHAKQFSLAASRLNSASPLAILGRGYGYITKGDAVISKASQTEVGDHLTINWHDGAKSVRVED